jgi:hypothetical protein
MIVLFDVCQPQERPIAGRELCELVAHAVVRLRSRIHSRLAAQTSQPRRLAFGAPPAIGHQVPRDPEDITAQLLIIEALDLSPKQTTESVLHDIVRVACVTGNAVDVRPERARRPLIEPRKLDFGQRSTYTERTISFDACASDFPLISPIRRDSFNDTKPEMRRPAPTANETVPTKPMLA